MRLKQDGHKALQVVGPTGEKLIIGAEIPAALIPSNASCNLQSDGVWNSTPQALYNIKTNISLINTSL